MMDEARERVGRSLFSEGSGIDLEALLEQAFEVVPDYVELPEGIMGKTHFHGDGRFDVFISRKLSDAAEQDATSRRRLRSTMAHECAHIVMHGHLHMRDLATKPMFPGLKTDDPKVLCREELTDSFKQGGPGYDGQWWEYQANQGMACLLLPKQETIARVEREIQSRGFKSPKEVIRNRRMDDVVREIMRVFDVSMSVTTYRFQELGILPKEANQSKFEL